MVAIKNINVGNLLKNMRISNTNLTQEELAQLLNCTDGTISNYEVGRTQPDLEFIFEYAEACGYELKFYNTKTKSFEKIEYLSKDL